MNPTSLIFFITEKGEVKIVELNSFEAWTGGCLFIWGYDRHILMNTNNMKMDFRFVEKPIEDDLMMMIGAYWRRFILQVTGLESIAEDDKHLHFHSTEHCHFCKK